MSSTIAVQIMLELLSVDVGHVRLDIGKHYLLYLVIMLDQLSGPTKTTRTHIGGLIL